MTPMKRANTLEHSARIGHQLKLVAVRRAFSVNNVESASSVHTSGSSSFITDESENNGEQISVNEINTTSPSVTIQERPLSENRKV